jgi:two-component system, LuxR family, sensor histidine kinase TtrS
MSNAVRRCCGALALLMLGLAPADAKEEVRVGVLSYWGTEHSVAEWKPTFNHLSSVLPQYRFEVIPGDLNTLSVDVANNRLDFLITNPGHYVELEAEHGVARIATVEIQGGPPPVAAVGATLFTLATRSDLNSLTDLHGNRLGAVAADSFVFRQAWLEMQKEGINPFSDMQKPFFPGYPADKVIDAVRSGKVDVGIVRACLIEKMVAEGHVKKGEFRFVSAHILPAFGCQVSTRLYPDWPFVKLPHTSEALAKQVAQALLSMPPGPDHQNWTVPVDYHSVIELYQELKIGPYAVLQRRSLTQILWDNRYSLALLVLALAWWVIHVLRVQYLVNKRTEALREANRRACFHREELEHAARLSLVGEMAGSLAHEINQPLAAIANYARGCERRLQQNDDLAGILHGVQQIAIQAERGGEIVRRMRSFVRKRPPAQRRLDPGSLINATLALFEPARSEVVVQIDPFDTLPAVDADQLQIEEVLLNLLQNAVDAVEGMPQRRVSVRAASGNGVVEVTVADTGPGLDELTMSQLFNPFFTTKPQGLGLGLSLSRSIIEAHGGRLWAENLPQGGTQFRFNLPIAKDTIND